MSISIFSILWMIFFRNFDYFLFSTNDHSKLFFWLLSADLVWLMFTVLNEKAKFKKRKMYQIHVRHVTSPWGRTWTTMDGWMENNYQLKYINNKKIDDLVSMVHGHCSGHESSVSLCSHQPTNPTIAPSSSSSASSSSVQSSSSPW